MPDSPTTIALGTAWIGLSVAIWLVAQSFVQMNHPQSLAVAPSCDFAVEVVEGSTSRLECRGEHYLKRCPGLQPGDRVAFTGENCLLERGAMDASMKLVASLQLDINQASAEDLMLIRGIGPRLSRAIVAYREEFGPLATVNELSAVRGIGKKRLGGLRKYLTCATP